MSENRYNMNMSEVGKANIKWKACGPRLQTCIDDHVYRCSYGCVYAGGCAVMVLKMA